MRSYWVILTGSGGGGDMADRACACRFGKTASFDLKSLQPVSVYKDGSSRAYGEEAILGALNM